MRYLRKKIVGVTLSFLVSLVVVAPAQASKGGVERPNNTFTVGITFKSAGADRVCSGVLITPIIIVTAGHCIYDEKGAIGTNYYFTKPGVPLDAAIDPRLPEIKIVKVFSQPGFDVNTPGLPDDIAFIQLNMPIATTGFIRVATTDEVLKLTEKEIAKGYGYGAVFETKSGYSIFPREYHIHWNKPKSDLSTRIDLNSDIATACTGDSGGPITTILPSGEEILLAVMSGAARVVDSCGTVGPDGEYTMQAIRVSPYIALIKGFLPSPAPSPTPTKKIISINCYKGKIKKVVRGISPKCPKGYIKK